MRIARAIAQAAVVGARAGAASFRAERPYLTNGFASLTTAMIDRAVEQTNVNSKINSTFHDVEKAWRQTLGISGTIEKDWTLNDQLVRDVARIATEKAAMAKRIASWYRPNAMTSVLTLVPAGLGLSLALGHSCAQAADPLIFAAVIYAGCVAIQFIDRSIKYMDMALTEKCLLAIVEMRKKKD